LVRLGRDISRELDGSVLRRVLKKGDGYDTPNQDQIFDERTVNFVAGAGCVKNIPAGYVLNSLN
jgi:hypothetical protein